MRGLIAPSSLVSIRRNALSTSSKPEFMRSQRDLFQPTGVTCKQPLRQELNPELALSLLSIVHMKYSAKIPSCVSKLPTKHPLTMRWVPTKRGPAFMVVGDGIHCIGNFQKPFENGTHKL